MFYTKLNVQSIAHKEKTVTDSELLRICNRYVLRCLVHDHVAIVLDRFNHAFNIVERLFLKELGKDHIDLWLVHSTGQQSKCYDIDNP